MDGKIVIYEDYIHNQGLLRKTLTQLYPSHAISFCDATDILQGCLSQNIRLLVMPGGADLYFCEKLNGKANQLIRRYIEQGGTYLGICAGAYYACREIEWAKGLDQEIIGSRELALADCKATGPIYEFLQDQDITKSWMHVCTLSIPGENGPLSRSAIYSGGPAFYPGPAADYTVLASFVDLPGAPAAALSQQIGDGKAILTSNHPEMTAEHFSDRLYNAHNVSFTYEREIFEQLRTSPYPPFSLQSLLGLFTDDTDAYQSAIYSK